MQIPYMQLATDAYDAFDKSRTCKNGSPMAQQTDVQFSRH